MRTPVMLASGTVGYGAEYEGLIDFGAVGAIVLKTVTVQPREGNRPPRLCETEAGLLNAIGLENVGIERFLEEELPRASRLPAPLVASVGGGDVEEFAELARAAGEREEIAAVELNISCPNVERRRLPLWADPDRVKEVVVEARTETSKPLLVKLSPKAGDVVSVAQAAERAGADALVVGNTLPGMRIDVDARAPRLGNATGGLSGPALLPVNLALVWEVSAAVTVPVVGSGGVRTADHALEYVMAGATAVQVGTAVFSDPRAPSLIASGLARTLERDGLEDVSPYVGLARKRGGR
ncbi:MAG: dihydroorotate dehydrogenase [Candidatus Eisenbacteria bacterium]|nr:dihydroorotate dehydrogenase [Candidatus Eisenbacteria bacterium]